PQRVLVLDVRGFGRDGVDHTITKKRPDGAIIETKSTRKYAEVTLEDLDTGRLSAWEVLSMPAAKLLRDAVVRAGPDFRGNLAVSIRTEGRSLEKRFFVDTITAPATVDQAGDEQAAPATAP